jgi:hypothetical protein
MTYLDSKSHLTVHPKYGTWHSFRAVVVTNEPFSSYYISNSPSALVPCLLTPEEEEAAQAAMSRALQVSDESKLCDQLHGGEVPSDEVAEAWIAFRDSQCLVRARVSF